MASRVLAEMGTDIVKTYYCENFEQVTSKLILFRLSLQEDRNSIRSKKLWTLRIMRWIEGAAGVDMGRNIWQSKHPLAMMKAIHSIVHESYSVKEAVDLYEDCAEVKA